MKRRGLTIVLAVLLAILGTTGVLVYVNHANARALQGQRAVNVLVAKSLIPAGTSAANAQVQGLLITERLPGKMRLLRADGRLSAPLEGTSSNPIVGVAGGTQLLDGQAKGSSGQTWPLEPVIEEGTPEELPGTLTGAPIETTSAKPSRERRAGVGLSRWVMMLTPLAISMATLYFTAWNRPSLRSRFSKGSTFASTSTPGYRTAASP